MSSSSSSDDLRHFLLDKDLNKSSLEIKTRRTHRMHQITNTTAIKQTKPPTAPPTMGTMVLEDFDPCEGGSCEGPPIEVVRRTVLGGGEEVEVNVTNVTTPLSMVDDVSSVTTVGGGVVVTNKVVGVMDVTDEDDERVVEDDEDVDVVEHWLAKSVEVGLTSVMMLVITRGTDIVETPPMQQSIRLVLEIASTNARKIKSQNKISWRLT